MCINCTTFREEGVVMRVPEIEFNAIECTNKLNYCDICTKRLQSINCDSNSNLINYNHNNFNNLNNNFKHPSISDELNLLKTNLSTTNLTINACSKCNEQQRCSKAMNKSISSSLDFNVKFSMKRIKPKSIANNQHKEAISSIALVNNLIVYSHTLSSYLLNSSNSCLNSFSPNSIATYLSNSFRNRQYHLIEQATKVNNNKSRRKNFNLSFSSYLIIILFCLIANGKEVLAASTAFDYQNNQSDNSNSIVYQGMCASFLIIFKSLNGF